MSDLWPSLKPQAQPAADPRDDARRVIDEAWAEAERIRAEARQRAEELLGRAAARARRARERATRYLVAARRRAQSERAAVLAALEPEIVGCVRRAVEVLAAQTPAEEQAGEYVRRMLEEAGADAAMDWDADSPGVRRADGAAWHTSPAVRSAQVDLALAELGAAAIEAEGSP